MAEIDGGASPNETAGVSAGGELVTGLTNLGIDGQASLAFGPDGDLYIASREGVGLIHVNAGTLQTEQQLLFNNADNDGVFINGAMGMTFSPDGSRVLVCGFDSDNIVEVTGYDTVSPTVSEFVAAGGVNGPRRLEFGPDRNGDGQSDLYVTANGRFQFQQPAALVLGPDDGLLYVADSTDDSVLRFDPATGAFIDRIDLAQAVPGFDHAWGLAFGPDRDADGRQDVYVSGRVSGDVVTFDPLDLQVTTFVGSGAISGPTSVLFGPDSTGDGVAELYVGDALDGSVKLFDGASGAPLAEIVPSGAGGLINPTEMLIRTDSDNVQRLYVANRDGNSILRFDPLSGAFLDEFASGGGLQFPVRFAFGPDGNGDGEDDLYVSSRETDEVLRYDGETGAFLDVFVAAGRGGLNQPQGLVFIGDQLWVAGGSSQQLHLYNAATGAFEDSIPSQQAIVSVFDGQTGEFLEDLISDPPLTPADESAGLGNPGELHFHNGDLYVASRDVTVQGGDPSRINGIARYDANGNYIETFATGSLGDGWAFEWGPDGRLYVSDVEKHQILIFDGDTGAEIGVFAKQPAPGDITFIDTPFGITFGPDGRAYVVDSNGGANTIDSLFQLEGPLIPRLDAANEPLTALAVNVTASVTNIYEHNNATPLQDASPHSPGVTTSMISVPDGLEITDVNVTLDISHTNDADLDVFLIAPDGTRVELFTDVGGSGDNFTGTTLDDEAGQDITSGVAPFTGVFRPEGNLAALVAKQSNGVWTLEVSDDSRKDTGVLNSWSLEITGLIPAPTPGITVQPTSGRVTTEDGGADQFTIVLDSPPTDNVTIDVSTSDASEGLVASGARPGVHGDAHLHAGQLGPAASGDHHRAR